MLELYWKLFGNQKRLEGTLLTGEFADSIKMTAHQGLLLLNALMGFVSRTVNVFQLILKEQNIMSNLLLIKELLMLNSIVGFVCGMVKVFQKTLK
jgi:hypothetical protein